MRYAVVIEKAGDNNSAYVPDLPGCIATGDTREEAEREIRAAVRIHLDGMREDGQPAPEPQATLAYVEMPEGREGVGDLLPPSPAGCSHAAEADRCEMSFWMWVKGLAARFLGGGTEMLEYTFPKNPAATGYCVFPAALEDDELVLFHATPAENLEAIREHGFRPPDPTGKTGLASVSFAKRSVAALNHAMSRREEKPGAYCILAVRYATLNRKGLKDNFSDVHDYTLDPAPEIIGYCTVPASYVHK
jgi:predicted RNase H-like HicB family nuclease